MRKRAARSASKQSWILLIHQLPPNPTNLRVRIWRKLQKLGAVVIKNSVYILPANEKTHEDFQWLKQEIESAGGEATLFHADTVEGATDEEIIKAFQKARDEEFSAITAEFDGLTGAVREHARGKHLSPARIASHEAELEKLHAELERIGSNDFFNAKQHRPALAAYERCRKAIRSVQKPSLVTSSPSARTTNVDLTRYQGKRWVTRRNLHIDRLASAWLIRQFIDKRPRFYFVSEGETVNGAIAFDMFGAEFTHYGEDCTFETMLKRFALDTHEGLRELAEIVHDIDLKDQKFDRLEAAGLNAIINGLSETLHDDRKLLKQTAAIFDGLFAQLSKQAQQRKPNQTRTATRRSSKARSRNK